MRDKIKGIRQLGRIVRRKKAAGKKIVFTNGCFDILHYGHVRYLEDAKKKGDFLIVGLNSDSSVKRIKGKNRPIIPENDRAKTLAGLASVDFVVLFREDTPLKVIRFLKPDILVKGADWKKAEILGSDFVKAEGGRVFTVKLEKGRSTTNLIKKIASVSSAKSG